MLEEVREFGPVVLIPAAWLAAGAAYAGYLSDDGILVAHFVMAGFIAVFAITGWNEMDRGALRAWRLVLVAGLGITVAGIGGFFLPSVAEPLLATSLVGWMVLPAAGLAYTARELPDAAFVYGGGAALSILGAVLFVGSLVDDRGLLATLAFVMVAVGQTAGIVDAARR
ncbi:hypothetical protein [Natrinema ejinorense]|uniref:Uncharacterized protein n=1 Tax=Natrinema ejinorense TaxID=373386 RepID=A0A2A5QX66_9EURY|nr:hypothetical protein [Natrinema ejinorense]PCR91442.1 hypothetical protein CP557_13445 [Natrinema ejinorense]